MEVLFVPHLVFESLLYGLNFLETDPHAVKFSRSASALLPLAAFAQDKINSRRWTDEQPNTPDFFYDEPIKDVNKKPGEFPPGGVELSDAWVVAIVKSSNMSRDERVTTWLVVISAKGALRSGYVHKAQAAKLFDSEANNFKYALLDGQHNMFGAEVVLHGLPTRRPDKLKDVGAVTYGLVAQVENVKYDIMVHVAHDWS